MTDETKTKLFTTLRVPDAPSTTMNGAMGLLFEDSGEPHAMWRIAHDRCCCMRATFRIIVTCESDRGGTAIFRLDAANRHGDTHSVQSVVLDAEHSKRFACAIHNVRTPDAVQLQRITTAPDDTLVGDVVVRCIEIFETPMPWSAAL